MSEHTVSTNAAIIVRTRFEGIHNYPDAPDVVAFLRAPHRHTFHVEAKIDVRHDDRELEFLMVKSAVDKFIDRWSHGQPVWKMDSLSCEMVAASIGAHLVATYGLGRNVTVSVYEDGENGATVSYKEKGKGDVIDGRE